TARSVQRSGERVRIELADSWVSTEHAALERALGQWVVVDLGSKNGVVVDGERVTRRLLADGVWIEVGHPLLRFRTLDLDADAPDDRVGDATTSLVPEVERAMKRLADAAASGVSIVLLGESGVGKEVAARSIHERSGRTGSFVAVNCAGLVESLAA